jgi:hypothetical protein
MIQEPTRGHDAKFIPHDPDPLRVGKRVAVIVVMLIVIPLQVIIYANALDSAGSWITPTLIALFSLATLVIWRTDSLRHPLSKSDDPTSLRE